MKRIAFLLVPLLVLAALAPVAPLVSDAYAAKGAAFTTVDQAVDGTGHCANGNPRVNCNIYDGKEFVWLNGGPKAAKLGPDGQYFFAVLAPGGQHTPNDGGKKNLSDDFDAYTDRTFTVTSGKVSAYTGTHWFDSGSHAVGPADGLPPYIRLFPYADTPNPGGVYIMAICSLAQGYPVRARDCKYDAFKIRNAVPTPTATLTNSPTPTSTNSPTPTSTNSPTPTSTNSPTPTSTTTACVPQTTTADFSKFAPGASVGGLNTVAPNLNISSPSSVVKILPDQDPWTYLANGPTSHIKNGGLQPGGGFSELDAHLTRTAHHYIFTFAPGVSLTDFSIHMLDYGDLNPSLATSHLVTMTAYNASGAVVAQQQLSFTSPAEKLPTSSNLYGNLQHSGDAIEATSGQPGNWTWHVAAPGIVKVKLDEGVGYDPNIGFDMLTFTRGCP